MSTKKDIDKVQSLLLEAVRLLEGSEKKASLPGLKQVSGGKFYSSYNGKTHSLDALISSELERGNIYIKPDSVKKARAKSYPDLSWVKRELEETGIPIYMDIKEAYIFGSHAKGTTHSESDLDVGVILELDREYYEELKADLQSDDEDDREVAEEELTPDWVQKGAIKFTENYHLQYASEFDKPEWEGVPVDFQFFYTTDSVWKSYSKIPLK